MNYSAFFSGPEGELATFVCRFLEAKGALIEATGARIDLLLPKALSKNLALDDYISITPGTAADPRRDGVPVYPIHFGSPLLEKISAMAGTHPPLLAMDLTFEYLKQGGYDHLIHDQFEFYKTTGRVSGFGEVKTHYLMVTCKFLAQSDEQKEGLVDLAVNMETGAVVPEMVRNLSGVGKDYRKTISRAYGKTDIDRLMTLVGQYVRDTVEQELTEFKQSMNRRFSRDAASLDEYYRALEHEMTESLMRTGLSDRLMAERKEKIALIPGELAAKQADLLNKYSIRIKVSLSAAMAITTPAIKVLFTAASGRQQKNLSMIYNPVTKSMDPLVCEACGQSMYRIGLCKGLHLLCGACQAKGCSLCRT